MSVFYNSLPTGTSVAPTVLFLVIFTAFSSQIAFGMKEDQEKLLQNPKRPLEGESDANEHQDKRIKEDNLLEVSDPLVLLTLGRKALMQQGEQSRIYAEKCLKKSYELAENKKAALYLGYMYITNEKFQEAQQWFEKATPLAEAYFNLGEMSYFEQSAASSYGKAMEYFSHAYDQEYGNLTYIIEVARYHYKMWSYYNNKYFNNTFLAKKYLKESKKYCQFCLNSLAPTFEEGGKVRNEEEQSEEDEEEIDIEANRQEQQAKALLEKISQLQSKPKAEVLF